MGIHKSSYEWRTKLLNTRNGHGQSVWSPIRPYRLWVFSHKFEHPMPTPHYFSLPLILSFTHISIARWANTKQQTNKHCLVVSIYQWEFPHKIWPEIWYSTSILGSSNSHWIYIKKYQSVGSPSTISKRLLETNEAIINDQHSKHHFFAA